SKVVSVKPNAPDKRPKRLAVGLHSPRSILLIIAFETPDRFASSESGQPRASRSARSLSAIRLVGSSTIIDFCSIYYTMSPVKLDTHDENSRCFRGGFARDSGDL